MNSFYKKIIHYLSRSIAMNTKVSNIIRIFLNIGPSGSSHNIGLRYVNSRV